MKFLKYLRYLPFLVELISFIRQAETQYPSKGSGAQKLEFVRDRLNILVGMLETTGIISAKLAQTISGSATAIISLIVQIMNDNGGIPPIEPGEEAPTDPYSVIYDTQPDDVDFKDGDRVYRSTGDPTVWRVERADEPLIGRGGWMLHHTIHIVA